MFSRHLKAKDGLVTVQAAALAFLQTEGARFETLGVKVLDSQDSEAIHQMRVAARRMRAGLHCFKNWLPRPILAIDGELRWAFHALGAVRDSDVLIKDILDNCPETAARKDLIEELRVKRLEGSDLLAATLRSKRYAALIRSLNEALKRNPSKPKRLLVAVAPALIGTERDKVWRLARKLGSTMSRVEIHELRKRSKRFRYTLEFFAEPYGKRSKRMLKGLKHLQDQLGAYVDAFVAGKAMKDLLAEKRAEGQAKALAQDLIETYRARQDQALEELSAGRWNLSGPWRKLKREMVRVKREAKIRLAGQSAGTPLKIISSR